MVSYLSRKSLWRYSSWGAGDLLFNLTLLGIGLAALFLIILVKSQSAVNFWSDPLLFIYTVFVTAFQLSRVVGAMFFRHSLSSVVSSKSGNYEPGVTFIIPCKNEEESITSTVEKCFEVDYPKEKLEVVVINDGSTDSTLQRLLPLKSRYRNLAIVHWENNRGKRQGMARGFRRALGEIIVQLDSDSYIEPSSFRNMIDLFANPQVGAVCAHTDPVNADRNWLTRMQAAYYFISFRILKAAESAFFSVFCCSGCASAFRKDVILPVLDLWLEEKFLGLPVTWGDDRALTNWTLRMGYKTLYSDRVRAYTIVPEKLRTFLKQQVRWKKGWFVNSFFASKFVYKKYPFVSVTYFFPLILVTLITPFMAMRALIYSPITKGFIPAYYILGILLVAVIMTCYYRFVARANRYWPYVFVWSGINLLFLSFILFYALATIQDRRWGTR